MSQRKYAADTTVPPEKTMGEIRQLLKKHDCSAVNIIMGDTKIGVQFTIEQQQVRFVVPLPTMAEVAKKSDGSMMRGTQLDNAYEKMLRSYWRGLLLVIKAKLEALFLGIETVEQAFMAYLVMGNGQTVGDVILPQIKTGSLLLPSKVVRDE